MFLSNNGIHGEKAIFSVDATRPNETLMHRLGLILPHSLPPQQRKKSRESIVVSDLMKDLASSRPPQLKLRPSLSGIILHAEYDNSNLRGNLILLSRHGIRVDLFSNSPRGDSSHP